MSAQGAFPTKIANIATQPAYVSKSAKSSSRLLIIPMVAIVMTVVSIWVNEDTAPLIMVYIAAWNAYKVSLDELGSQ